MRCHSSILISRMIRAGLRVHRFCSQRVVAAGLDARGTIISIATNGPANVSRGKRGSHAEEKVIFNSPRSLSRIVIIRVNKRGALMPIDPCDVCAELARKRNIKIEGIRVNERAT